MVEFLRHILPSDGGFYCIVGIKQGIVKPRFISKLDGIDNLAEKLCGAEFNVYFACASYKDDTSGRKVENIKALKSFFLDIDCGEEKPYETKELGLTALNAFVKRHQLPKPWIVDSGGGIHAYWELEQEIEYAAWKEVADKLKMLCKESDFSPDPAVTADGARILRLPGTNNLKETENPRPVTLLLKGKPVAFETFKTKINPMQAWIAPKSGWKELDPVTKAFLGKNFVSSFKRILDLSLEGNGCEQIKFLYENQPAIQEPLWRAGLSIAVFCEDGDTAIHTISEKHPNYNKDETVHKASLIKGPYTCERFAELGDAGFCKRCEYSKEGGKEKDKAKIRSPISIGRVVSEAKGDDRFVTQFDTVIKEMVTFEIPDYPPPYFRREGGGVFRRAWHEEDKDKEVYEHDLYIIKRYKDPDEGYIITMRLHTPKDGVLEFSLPTSQLSSIDNVRTTLGKNGVHCHSKQYNDVQLYLEDSLQHLQKTLKAEVAQPHMGWVDGYKAFIIGSKEVSAGGVIHGPSSKYTQALAPHMIKKGDLEEWKKVIDLFDKIPDNETHAFVFLSAFGAPLMEFTDHYGATFIAKSEGSGSGKTAVLMAINSVWGHPKNIMTEKPGTDNFKMSRVGTLCNIPVCWDEMTNISGEELSELFYLISAGVGKGRMERHSNVERTNYSKWKTIVLFSSNQDNAGKLLEIKRSPQAELARFLEFEFKKSTVVEAMPNRMELFSPLYDNYGMAGEIYAQYLVEHVEEVKQAVLQMQRKLVREVNPKHHMRFWVTAIACNLVGGIIAKRLGLIDFNMAKIYKWITRQIGDIRAEAIPDSLNDRDPIGEYANDMYANHTLVVNAGKATMIPEAAIKEPKDTIFVRVEPDTMRMYLVETHFRKYCSKFNIHYEQLITQLTAEGRCLGVKKMKLLRGTMFPQASTLTTYCVIIDLMKDSNADKTNSSRGELSDKPKSDTTGGISVHTDVRSPEIAESTKDDSRPPT